MWVTELARTKCCSFNETYYRIGTTLLSRVLPDDCTNVALRCRKKEVFADMVIEVEDYCPERPGIIYLVAIFTISNIQYQRNCECADGTNLNYQLSKVPLPLPYQAR